MSTDSASNLDEVLGTRLGMAPLELRSVPGLWGMNVNRVQAAKEYRELVVAPYRGALPVAAIERIEEQLSVACTVKIAAFDEFTQLLGDAEYVADFDHVIFDTAPTGHTLRRLQLPAAWSNFTSGRHAGARSHAA